MSNDEIGLDEAYSVRTPDDNRRLYAKWAATYESGWVDVRKYRYPRAIAELFDACMPADFGQTVVDIGCGTGLAGMYLSRLRPALQIDGIDISPEMLQQSAAKRRDDGSPVYLDLFERDLTQPVESTNAPYDALISSGTFTHGHLGPEAIENLLPLVRTEGRFLIGANAEHFAAKGFDTFLSELVARNVITAPRYERIHVYEEGSPHYGDQSVVSLFARR